MLLVQIVKFRVTLLFLTCKGIGHLNFGDSLWHSTPTSVSKDSIAFKNHIQVMLEAASARPDSVVRIVSDGGQRGGRWTPHLCGAAERSPISSTTVLSNPILQSLYCSYPPNKAEFNIE